MRFFRLLENSRLYPLLVVAGLLLPCLLITVALWNSFTAQLDLSQQKRLHTNLQIFELMLEQELDEFRNALSRLAADNRLQKVDPDILPQLHLYLKAQMQNSNFAFLIVSDSKGRQLLQLGELPDQGINCGFSVHGIAEQGSVVEKNLYLSRIATLSSSNGLPGYLCGGFAISGKTFIASVAAKLNGTPTIAWRGQPLSAELDPQLPSPAVPAEVVYRTGGQGGVLKGMYKHFPLGSETIDFGILIDLTEQQNLASRELRIIGFVLIALLSAAGYGVRMFNLRRRAEQALRREREQAMVILNSIADAVVSTDANGRIAYLNPAAEQLISFKAAEVAGSNCYQIIDMRSERSGQKIPFMAKGSQSDGVNTTETDAVLVARNGEKTAVHFSVAKVKCTGTAAGCVIVLRNMGKERELKRRLAWKASRDDLTGLLNRGEFRRTLSSAIEQAQTEPISQGLLYIDLDEFKIVNDTCGHQAGDRLLKQVSTLLLTQTRKADTVARLGGDEFGVLLANCSTKEAIEIANSLIDSINDIRFSFMNKVFHVGASVGLVNINQKTCDLEDLLATVDAACYTAKEQGRNRVFVGQVDTRKINLRVEELNQASRIRHALRDDRLELFYQPIVDTKNPARRQHLEILVRMLDKGGALVAPGAFIPVAERNGLMQDVDRWIIHHLFETEGERLRSHHARNAGDTSRSTAFVYTINLSGASLVDPAFLEYVKNELRRFAIPPETIGFEITETQVITHMDKAIHFMSELKDLGCSFLLDDFGSGMSSFGYLKNLPVDYLKIDGLFVKDICSDPIDYSMVKAINEIGHVMGLRTIAEYVENDEILLALEQIGVDMAQGYSIAQPKPLSSLRQLPQAQATQVAAPLYATAGQG